MSEYIEIETEIDEDDPAVVYFFTNLPLAQEVDGEDRVEEYGDPAALGEGSPLAQALAAVEGIAALRIEGSDLTVRCEEGGALHAIVADVSAVLKDFFL